MTTINPETEAADISAPALRIEYRPAADLVPFENNARTHDATNIKAIAASLKKYGFRKPLVIWRDNIVLAGNGTLEAAKLEGFETVPCADASHLSFSEAREYVVSDNKTSDLSDWNAALLASELEAIAIDMHSRDEDIALPGFTDADMLAHFDPDAFDGDEVVTAPARKLPSAITKPAPKPEPKPKVAAPAKPAAPAARQAEKPATTASAPTPIKPVLPKTPRPVSRPGDVWTLGAHRLVCAGPDPLKDIRNLLKTTPADLVLANPDAMMTAPEEPQIMRAYDRVADLLKLATPFLRVACPVYAAAGYTPPETVRLVDTLAAANIAASRFLIGDTIGAALVGPEFPLRHRIVLYAHTAGTPAFTPHESRPSILDWPALEPDRHSASFPESVITAALLSSTQKEATILDLGGNGLETLAACEAQSREARLIEADPLRCDAILQAYVDWTGEQPVCNEVDWSETPDRQAEKVAA